MFRIVLFEPEIPQNTGNIARLCAASNIELLLVGKLGFSLEDKYLKRSGMDYWNYVKYSHIKSIDEYMENYCHFICISTKGTHIYSQFDIVNNSDVDIIFGSEGSGLPKFIYEKYTDRLYRIPMKEDVRSLNLSSSAAVITYCFLEKLNYPNLV